MTITATTRDPGGRHADSDPTTERTRDRPRTTGQLDADRDAADQRTEQLTGAALLALERRAAAAEALVAATGHGRAAVRALLAEGIGTDRAAALLDLETTELRRLLKTTAPSDARGPSPSDDAESVRHGAAVQGA